MLEKEVRHFLAPKKGFMHFVHGRSSKRNSQIKMVEVSLKMRLEYICSFQEILIISPQLKKLEH